MFCEFRLRHILSHVPSNWYCDKAPPVEAHITLPVPDNIERPTAGTFDFLFCLSAGFFVSELPLYFKIISELGTLLIKL